MREEEREKIMNFCKALASIASEMSEQRLIYCLAALDQELHSLQKKTDVKYMIKLYGRMMSEVENLTRGIESVGFGQYMEDYPKTITAFLHEVEEETNSKEEGWNDYNMLNIDNELRSGPEDYEPNPYDGTYSEE